MNREIEFRVYDEDLKKMRYLNTSHDFICFDEDGSGYYHNMQTGLGDWFSDLMQYTGLKDKNGKKIFEGDIVESEYRIFKSTVEWNDSFCGFFPFCNTQTGIFADECEVIGNIYENNLESKGEQ